MNRISKRANCHLSCPHIPRKTITKDMRLRERQRDLFLRHLRRLPSTWFESSLAWLSDDHSLLLVSCEDIHSRQWYVEQSLAVVMLTQSPTTITLRQSHTTASIYLYISAISLGYHAQRGTLGYHTETITLSYHTQEILAHNHSQLSYAHIPNLLWLAITWLSHSDNHMLLVSSKLNKHLVSAIVLSQNCFLPIQKITLAYHALYMG